MIKFHSNNIFREVKKLTLSGFQHIFEFKEVFFFKKKHKNVLKDPN